MSSRRLERKQFNKLVLLSQEILVERLSKSLRYLVTVEVC